MFSFIVAILLAASDVAAPDTPSQTPSQSDTSGDGGAREVQVQKLDGNSLSGVLKEINADAVVLALAEGPQRIETSQIVSVEVCDQAAAVPAPQPSVTVELVDNSVLHSRSYAVTGRQAAVELLSSGPIEIDRRAITQVQFRSWEDQDQLQEQWEAIATSQRAGDTIVVLKKSVASKPSASRFVYALDSLDGVLHDITAQSVQFEFDGQRIPVNRDKVAGVIYYHPRGRELPEPVCRLVDVDGSQWFLRALQLDRARVKAVTTAGVQVTLPLEQIARFDFSSVNTDYLHHLTPVTDAWQMRLGFGRRLVDLKSSYRQFSNAHYAGDLKIYSESGFGHGAPGERVYGKGIAMHSRSKRQYLLNRKYQQFSAIVAIDARYRQFGSVQLRITGDRRVLFEQLISGADEEPWELNLDVSGVRRLSIVVDYGTGGGIGDRLNLCDARLSK